MNDLPVIAYAPPICKRCGLWLDGLGCSTLFNQQTRQLGAYPLDLHCNGKSCYFFELIKGGKSN